MARHSFRLVLLAAVGSAALLLGVGCGSSSSGGGSTNPDGPSATEVEEELVRLLNEERADNGVPPLAVDTAAREVARDHSEAMRDQGFFGHEGPSGQGLAERLDAGGVSYTTAGENLALVTGAADPAGFAHQKLMASEEHRVNILSPVFTRVGVGVAASGSTYWITQDFVS